MRRPLLLAVFWMLCTLQWGVSTARSLACCPDCPQTSVCSSVAACPVCALAPALLVASVRLPLVLPERALAYPFSPRIARLARDAIWRPPKWAGVTQQGNLSFHTKEFT
jgi:hypothetical protein